MRIIDCEQGTEEWFKARLGVVSASKFKAAITQPRSKKDQEAGKLSDGASTYLGDLVAELLTGERHDIGAKALEWGTTEEPKAALDYSLFHAEEAVVDVGFVMLDDANIGASPDGLVGLNGGVEIKSPLNRGIHMATIISGEIPKDHLAQVQGGMWICEREWWDFISFRNDMPAHLRSFTVRVYRDEEYIRDLATKVRRFACIVEETFDKYK